MKTIMKLEDLKTIDQLIDFLSGTHAVAFSVISDKKACYRWIQTELVRFRYLTTGRQGKGVVTRYLMKVSGYSRQQMTRLIRQYRQTPTGKKTIGGLSGHAYPSFYRDRPVRHRIARVAAMR